MTYSKPSQTSKMELFVIIVNDFHQLTILAKNSTLYVLLDTECVFETNLKTVISRDDKETTEASLQLNMKMINRFFVKCLTHKSGLSLFFRPELLVKRIHHRELLTYH